MAKGFLQILVHTVRNWAFIYVIAKDYPTLQLGDPDYLSLLAPFLHVSVSHSIVLCLPLDPLII